MNTRESQLQGLGDARLAVHATSALPAWLWSSDGTRVLWANPVGARLFGAANAADLANKRFGPADPHRRQIAQLAGRLSPAGAVRLERLRGFGAKLGGLMTCGCARLDFPDGGHGILIAAAETSGRAMPLIERLQRLVEGADIPLLAFARDGMFVGASETAAALFGFRDLAAADLEQARGVALAQGRAELPIPIGHLVLRRVGERRRHRPRRSDRAASRFNPGCHAASCAALGTAGDVGRGTGRIYPGRRISPSRSRNCAGSADRAARGRGRTIRRATAARTQRWRMPSRRPMSKRLPMSRSFCRSEMPPTG